jgi:hypothetical protein
MSIHQFDEQPDELLATHLRALHELPAASDVTALRRRIINAATSPLAIRARNTMRAVARPTWLDVTGGFGRIAIPLSLAAALLAMVLMRKLPKTAEQQDLTTALAYELTYSATGESNGMPSIAEQLLMPQSADEVLLAPVSQRDLR